MWVIGAALNVAGSLWCCAMKVFGQRADIDQVIERGDINDRM